jgi:hypothetical protein
MFCIGDFRFCHKEESGVPPWAAVVVAKVMVNAVFSGWDIRSGHNDCHGRGLWRWENAIIL